ncbi:MAG: hypothetical protein NDI75_05910 [Candidatus Didemnitutus sp.]|nr:hypothetical protein [Candidatus Didemnitutus sp.]
MDFYPHIWDSHFVERWLGAHSNCRVFRETSPLKKEADPAARDNAREVIGWYFVTPWRIYEIAATHTRVS